MGTYRIFSKIILIAISLCWSSLILAQESIPSTAKPAPPTKTTSSKPPIAQKITPTEAEKVYQKVNHSIFSIYGIDSLTKRGIALGSAVAIGSRVLATNCHIALAGDYLIIKIDNKPHVGQLFYYNKKDDLCLVYVPNVKFNAVKIRPSQNVQIGEDVYAIGNPVRFEKTISKGIISNKINRGDVILLQTDASISPGSSGGGLFDVNGNLIGITTKKARIGESLGFAIPTELILAVLKPKPSDQTRSTPTETNNQPVPKKVETVQNTITDSVFKTYGDKKIALGKWRRSCVIAITGFDEKKNAKSLAFWIPSVPNGFFIFPYTYEFNTAINLLNNFIHSGYPTLKNTNNTFILDNQRYPLRGEAALTQNFPLLILGTRESFKGKLLQSNSFRIELTQPDASTTKIEFDLGDFKNALNDYGTVCTDDKRDIRGLGF